MLYENLFQQVETLLENKYDFIANSADIFAVFFQQLLDLNWVGFYF